MKKLITLTISLLLVCALCSGCLGTLLDVASTYLFENYEDYDQTSYEGYSSSSAYPEPVYSPDDTTWSVFIYMCGTDLESTGGAATSNLVELLEATTTDSVNLVVQTGGTKSWQNYVVQSDRLQRYTIKNHELELVDEQELSSMGAESTLGDFLSWGVKTYPADKYMAIFWNHGGGSIGGLAYDEMFDYDQLTLDELSNGLAAPGVTFEAVGFDTCLMATLETAAAISPYARYMIASEEYEPGGGWDYTAWARYLCAYPNSTGAELGRIICDSYYDKCNYTGDAEMATLSLTDLTKIPALVTAFDAMATEMTGITSEISTLRTFTQGAMRAENYGGNTEQEGYTNMVDLGDLAINTESVLPGTADKLLDALFDTVVYQVKGASRKAANGLSVFFPLAVSKSECDLYSNISTSKSYLRFVETIVPDWDAPQWLDSAVAPLEDSVQMDDYNVEAESYIDPDGYFMLDVTQGIEAVQSVMFSLYYLDYDYNEYMLLGMDNDIETDWDSGIFADNFRGVWPTINGEYCAPTLICEEADYNLYSIPILLNDEPTNLRAAYIWDTDDTGHFEIYGAWAGVDTDTGMSARDIIKLRDGDRVEMLFDAVNWDTGESTTYSVGSFTVDGDVIMEESDLFDGEYLYQYEITDIFGRKLYSAEVIMEVKNGEITISETE
ncbi:MAG: clostripain-related cysteine peptidase [Clostridia bacterium]